MLWMILPVMAWEVKTTKQGTPIRWAVNNIDIDVQTTGTHGLTKEEILEAVSIAVNTWNSQSLNNAITLSCTDEGREANSVLYFTDSWDHKEDTLAYTSITNNEDSGEILSSSISISSGKNEDWHWSITGEDGSYDLINALIHEFGHALGLDHSSITNAIMAYQGTRGDSFKRELHQDDVEGYQFLYSEADPDQTEERKGQRAHCYR